ncbi:MAG TPA: histidinol-phosphate transaminase [Bacteroidia bacterium]
MFELNNKIRENIKKLVPYSSARDEYKGKEGIFLDANENSYGSPSLPKDYNRYPDPLQLAVKEKLSKIKGQPPQNIFLGNGSDEAIDILLRAFCGPGTDNVIICPPTYGMYEVAANINDVEVKKVNLIPETFQLDVNNILTAINERTKLVFVCCPNNPTGNSVKDDDVIRLLKEFRGIVVVDEAYINFSPYRSSIRHLLTYPNLVILQTLSKAWGLAGLRIGMAFASQQIIDVFNKIKPPYNINSASQEAAMLALDDIDLVNRSMHELLEEREKLAGNLAEMPFVIKVYPSDANFLLVKMKEPRKVYDFLAGRNIIVRDRSKVPLCEGCLRITVGTWEENIKLIDTLKEFTT